MRSAVIITGLTLSMGLMVLGGWVTAQDKGLTQSRSTGEPSTLATRLLEEKWISFQMRGDSYRIRIHPPSEHDANIIAHQESRKSRARMLALEEQLRKTQNAQERNRLNAEREAARQGWNGKFLPPVPYRVVAAGQDYIEVESAIDRGSRLLIPTHGILVVTLPLPAEAEGDAD
jgi:hypothetical protein